MEHACRAILNLNEFVHCDSFLIHLYAEEEFTKLADTQPDMPIGVAFVDKEGNPGWIGQDPTLHIHQLSIRSCLPTMHFDADD